jgi:hypothetical protein
MALPACPVYRASKADCDACALRSQCCPNTPARKVPRSIHETARDMARAIANSWEGRTSRRLRKKVEMLFAHLKRILKLDRLRLRGPYGARDEFVLAQNLRKLASWSQCRSPIRPKKQPASPQSAAPPSPTDFFNTIGQKQTSPQSLSFMVWATQAPTFGAVMLPHSAWGRKCNLTSPTRSST